MVEKIDFKKIKVVAMDLDGTLTQHKQPLDKAHKDALNKLSEKYKLLMAGAGQVMRIFNQMEQYPIDIIGNYGLQFGVYVPETKEIKMLRDITFETDKESIDKKVTALREKYGFTEFAGENTEFHPSGCLTFPILGTKAKQEDKLAFDPDRTKRRKIYAEVVETFSDYSVFVGGSSSFDMASLVTESLTITEPSSKSNGFFGSRSSSTAMRNAGLRTPLMVWMVLYFFFCTS